MSTSASGTVHDEKGNGISGLRVYLEDVSQLRVLSREGRDRRQRTILDRHLRRRPRIARHAGQAGAAAAPDRPRRAARPERSPAGRLPAGGAHLRHDPS